MKARLSRWWSVLLALPLLGAYAFQGCTANTMRDVATGLNDQADQIDGGEDVEFGDWLAEGIKDW